VSILSFKKTKRGLLRRFAPRHDSGEIVIAGMGIGFLNGEGIKIRNSDGP
jgi:hypothetical protein